MRIGAGAAVEAGRTTLWWLGGWMLAAPVLVAVHAEPQHARLAVAGAALAVALLVGTLLRPSWGAYLLIVLVYWNASDVVTDTWGFSWLLRLAILLAAGAGALELGLAAAPRRWRAPLLVPLMAYVGVQCLAALTAGDRAAATAALSESAKGVAVFFLLAQLLSSLPEWRRALDALLAGTALLAAPVLYQGVTGSQFQFWGFGAMKYEEIVTGDWGWRLAGAVSDPNFLAMVLVAVLSIAAVVALEPQGGRLRRALALLALVSALGATVFTYSRAALLGVALVGAALLARRARRGLLLAGMAGIIAMGAALVPSTYLTRVLTLNEVSLTRQQQEIPDLSFRIRRNELLAGWLMFEQHPLLGVGPGNYESNYLHYSALAGLSGESTVRDPHSLYIQIAAETGLAGLATFFYLLLATFRMTGRARRDLRRRGAQRHADLIWALEVALVTYLTLSIFLHGAYFRHFMVLLALAAIGAELARQAAVTSSEPARLSLTPVPVPAHG